MYGNGVLLPLLGLVASGARAVPMATPAADQAMAINSIDWAIPDVLLKNQLYGKPANNFACRSKHNPVVMLHGLSANAEVDLNSLQYYLNERGYCTFSQTYGAHTLVPWIGGVTRMRDSAADIAAFIREVQQRTGAAKVDVVGHSEGGVQTLLVPLTQPGIAGMLGHTVALGPAVWGAQYYGFTDLFYLGGEATRALAAAALRLLGCQACDDMATGGEAHAAFQAARGRIVQAGVKASVVVSRSDTLVAPEVSVVREAGVRNVVVQDHCPDDRVGHAGLAWDKSVWGIVLNELEEAYDRPVMTCEQGLPFKS